MRTILLSPRLLVPGLGLAVLACAGGDLNLPNDGAPVGLTAVSGDGQEATVGSRLPKPLVVRVTDAASRPVADVPLVFRFQDAVPDAEIDPASVATDSTGRASVRVRLGTLTGTQTIEATIDQPAAAESRAIFEVTALEKHGHGHGGGDD
jgi:hypothetical protein